MGRYGVVYALQGSGDVQAASKLSGSRRSWARLKTQDLRAATAGASLTLVAKPNEKSSMKTSYPCVEMQKQSMKKHRRDGGNTLAAAVKDIPLLVH